MNTELTCKQELTYIGIGVLIAITYTVLFIVFFGGDVSEVQVNDFPIEKFNEGYNILTLESGEHLIQLSDVIDLYVDQEGDYNFATVDQSTIREYHVRDGYETNSFSGYGYGGKGWEVTQVIGLDTEFPVYIVKRVYGNIFGWNIFPLAYGQVQPFELQLEQIRNPEQCTRKVLTSAGAYLPFTLKVFYDTTQDRKWSVISKAETFPVAQQSAQVATFFSPEVDQYEVYLEINYDRPAKRQVFVEVLSEGKTVVTWQEQFTGTKFCMTFFINTNDAPTFPTREDLIGDLLTNVDQIPAMITSFNANTITWNSSISYMWTLIFGSIVLSVLTLIGTSVINRSIRAKIKDMDEAINIVDSSAQKIDELTEPLNEIIKNQKLIIAKSPDPLITEKKSKLKTIIKRKTKQKEPKKENKGWFDFLRRKKDDEDDTAEEDLLNEPIEVPPKATKEENKKLVKAIEKMEEDEHAELEPRTEKDEVLEALQVTPEDVKEERKQKLSGGFVIIDEDEVIPEKQVKLVPEKKPPKFKEVLRAIDYEKNTFKEGTFDQFEYNDLNRVYSWIIHYKNRKIQNNEWEDIPEKVREQQEVAGHIIYNAIMAKLEKKRR